MMASRLSSHCRRHAVSMMGPSMATSFSPMNSAEAMIGMSSSASARRFRSDGPKKQGMNKNKKPKSKNDYFGSGVTDSRDKTTEIALRALNAKKRKPPPADEAEMARRAEIGRQYVIGRFNQHNEINHDLACKISIKHHAIKMLPRNSYIREEALKENYYDDYKPGDPIEPPFDRIIPQMYPPLPNSPSN